MANFAPAGPAPEKRLGFDDNRTPFGSWFPWVATN
jgi:hypothetical protein